jgi:hypothetical protein
MDVKVIVENLIAALTGGMITGGVAWIKFDKALTILRADVDRFKEECDVCRGGLRVEDAKLGQSIVDLARTVQAHHESGPHYQPADRLLNDERWKEVRGRLISIEDHLRNGKRAGA